MFEIIESTGSRDLMRCPCGHTFWVNWEEEDNAVFADGLLIPICPECLAVEEEEML